MPPLKYLLPVLLGIAVVVEIGALILLGLTLSGKVAAFSFLKKGLLLITIVLGNVVGILSLIIIVFCLRNILQKH